MKYFLKLSACTLCAILLALSFVCGPAFAQIVSQPLEWNLSCTPGEDGCVEVIAEGRFAEAGWHIYDLNDYGQDGPNATVFKVESDSAVPEGEPAILSVREEEFNELYGITIGTLGGDIVLSQKMRLADGVESCTARVSIEWQCCNESSCLPPETYSSEVTLGKPSGEAAPEGSASPLWAIILEAILWGFAMILTPCVFPMVPMTVSFFIKREENKSRGRLRASLYGLFIILLYTVPICAIIGLTRLFGGQAVTADIFNWLSTHWLPNIVFFAVFMVFAASFFGAFELTLPSSWVNASDKKSDSKGLGGVFFLALTLVLVSFSCTGPIVGTVLIKSTQGQFWTPMVTMLAFSTAFALPFALLAFFPSLLKNLPRSGGWLGSVKVVLGFVEIALGLKFLSTADQTYHWHLLDREVYLAIWIVVFTMLGFYLLGKLRFAGEEKVEHIGVTRLGLSIAVFSFVVYMIPGMWGAPLKAISGYLPPIETQDFVLSPSSRNCEVPEPHHSFSMLDLPYGLKAFDNIEDALALAESTGRRVFVDITGYGCVNCREMEARVWSDPEVLELLQDNFVIVALYNDDKRTLPESEWITTPEGKTLKDVGRVNSYIVRTRFGVNAQPNYALLDSRGNLLCPIRGYNLDIPGFVSFLKSVL